MSTHYPTHYYQTNNVNVVLMIAYYAFYPNMLDKLLYPKAESAIITLDNEIIVFVSINLPECLTPWHKVRQR